MSVINDFIQSLSPEEREQHRELIEECRRRELNIQIDIEKARARLPEAREAQEKLYHGLDSLKTHAAQALGAISDASLELRNCSFNQYCDRKDQEGE